MSNSWQSKGWGLAESYARKLRSEQCEPVKFEAGQVIGVDIYGDGNEAPLLVCKMNAPVVTTNELRCGGVEVCLRPQEMVVSPALLSPAPRAGDTWTSGESVARIELCAHGDTSLRIISEGEPFVGDVVAVARRLWEGGFRKVEIRHRSAAQSSADVIESMKARAECAKHEGQQSVALLPGITPIERTPDGGQRVTRNDLPRAGEYWKNATTMIVLRECLEGLHTCVIASEERWPMQHIGNAEQTAEFLRENGYRRAADHARMAEQNPPRVTGAALTALACERLNMERLPNESDEALRDRMARTLMPGMRSIWHRDNAIDRVRDCIEQCAARGDSVGDAARSIERILESARVDRATGDDLRKLAELQGVPELRAGMVVRWDRGGFDGLWFGHVETANGAGVLVRWSSAQQSYKGHQAYTPGAIRDYLAESWRIVTPDVAPLASLANAVAAIFERPDLATSRRYIDTAIATLRGEPFSGAIAAALVGVAERTALAPVEIAACIAALRHWEARRPFDRDLRALQRRTGDRLRGGPWNRLQCECNELLAGIVGRRPDWNYDSIYFVYERARTV